MSYDSTDSLRRGGGSRSNIGASMSSSSRPFLNLLNPINRPHRGYQQLNEVPLQEEDEEEPQEQGHWAEESHQLRGVSSPPPSRPQERDTELTDEDDDVPQSFMIEAAAAPRKHASSSTSGSRREKKSSRRKRPGQEPSSAASPRLSKPPRPSELDSPSVMDSDRAGTSTAYATTRPQSGLNEQQKALWNWVNVYNLDAYLQEVSKPSV